MFNQNNDPYVKAGQVLQRFLTNPPITNSVVINVLRSHWDASNGPAVNTTIGKTTELLADYLNKRASVTNIPDQNTFIQFSQACALDVVGAIAVSMYQQQAFAKAGAWPTDQEMNYWNNGANNYQGFISQLQNQANQNSSWGNNNQNSWNNTNNNGGWGNNNTGNSTWGGQPTSWDNNQNSWNAPQTGGFNNMLNNNSNNQQPQFNNQQTMVSENYTAWSDTASNTNNSWSAPQDNSGVNPNSTNAGYNNQQPSPDDGWYTPQDAHAATNSWGTQETSEPVTEPTQDTSFANQIKNPEQSLKEPSQRENAPYPFAYASLHQDGHFVHGFNLHKIPREKRGVFQCRIGHNFITHEDRYLVDNNGNVCGFYTYKRDKPYTEENDQYALINKENTMDKEKHDLRRYFADQNDPTRVSELLVNDTRLNVLSAPASALDDVIAEAKEIAQTIEGDERPLIASHFIDTNKVVNCESGVGYDDYVAIADDLVADTIGELADTGNNVVKYGYNWMMKNVVAKTKDVDNYIKDLRLAQSFTDVQNAFISLGKSGAIDSSQYTMLNELATAYINRQLATRFGNDYYIDSFASDASDVLQDLVADGVYGEEFAEVYKEVVDKILMPVVQGTRTFDNYYTITPKDDADKEAAKLKFVGFGLSREIIVLPIAGGDLPLFVSGEANLLAKTSLPKLYTLVDKAMDDLSDKQVELILVTSDNRMMVVNRSNIKDVYQLTYRSFTDNYGRLTA